MEKHISLSAPLKRISVLDALRGFALFGVITMHMLQRFGTGFGRSQEEVLRFPALDEEAQWIGNNIIMGRFINIFAANASPRHVVHEAQDPVMRGTDVRMLFAHR